MERLSGKVALVTGASRGIGSAVVTRIAAEGATVAVNYRENARNADELVTEVADHGGTAAAFQADVAEVAQSARLVDDVVAKFGRLDIVVSNAGVEHFAPLPEITEADFDRVFSVNTRGQLFVAQQAARHMGEGGSMVLTSSVSATRSVFHHAVYAASKAAVNAMVLNLAAELGQRDIRINAIAPGGTATDMASANAPNYKHPELDVSMEEWEKTQGALRRIATPAEIAAVTAFLVSDDASYITGRTIEADGGFF